MSEHDPVPALLDARALTHRHRADVGVFDVNLSARKGDVVALLGLNGAGKSTTLRLLAGLVTPQAGEIRIDGHDLTDEPLEARQRLGYLAETPPLFADQRVSEYLRLCARLRRVPASQVPDRVEVVLDSCELTEVRSARLASLSTGYRQRVGLAQAIIHRPAVVLLDEPANGLDPKQLQSMQRLIGTLAEHAAVLFSTHLLSEAQAICNRVVMMHQGRVVHDVPTKRGQTDLQTLFHALVDGHSEVAA